MAAFGRERNVCSKAPGWSKRLFVQLSGEGPLTTHCGHLRSWAIFVPSTSGVRQVTVGEYTAAFTSIIVGLAIADLVISLQRLLRSQKLVVWDFLTPLAALLAGASVINVWWSLYAPLVSLDRITIAAFIPNLISLLLLFLVAAAAFPHEVPPQGINLRDYYERSRRAFWVPFALYMAWAAFGNAFAAIRTDSPAGTIAALTLPNLLLMAVMIVLATNERRWVHVLGLGFLLLVVLSAWLPQEMAAKI